MRCKRCGEELPDRARFCFVCGEPVEDVPAPHRLEEPLDPMAAGAVPMVPVAPPPRAVRIEPRVARAARRPVHPGVAAGAAERRVREAEQEAHRVPERAAAQRDEQDAEADRTVEQAAASADEQVAAPHGEQPRDVTDDQQGSASPSLGERLSALRQRISAARAPWVLPVIGGVVVVVAIVVLVGISTSWIGPFAQPAEEAPQVQPPSDGSITPLDAGEDEASAQEEPAPEGEPTVRDAVDDYSWQELSQISALIADAPTDEEGLSIAEQYNLCGPGGALDGTQAKDVELSDGTVVSFAVAGFRQDTRADGEGEAGITFVSMGPVGRQVYSPDGPVIWEDSALRSWMNQSLMGELPSELADVVVPVTKQTDALAGSGGDLTETTDSLWILSLAELSGLGMGGDMPDEGTQYQLFEQGSINDGADVPTLCDDYWWLRSPSSDPQWQRTVSPEGSLASARNPTYEFDVVAGFCL